MAPRNNQPLIVIVGPTASGKTATAIELAKNINGEIICADSRTVYKDMDIGTAKPTNDERREVPHHLIDVVRPDERFTAASFQKLAKEKIAEIRRRDKVPIIVGGTGLYVDSIVFDYKFGAQTSEISRQKFENQTIEELWDYCQKNNITIPDNRHNKRYVVRAIEQKGINKHKRDRTIDNCIVVGISTDKDTLIQRIENRAEGIFSNKLLQETQQLAKKYGWSHESMTASIYSLANAVNQGKISREVALQKFITLDWRLAKRQLTWFRRNEQIVWCKKEALIEVVLEQMASRQA